MTFVLYNGLCFVQDTTGELFSHKLFLYEINKFKTFACNGNDACKLRLREGRDCYRGR